MQVGPNTPSVVRTPHIQLWFSKNGKDMKTPTHILVPTSVYEVFFRVGFRSRRLMISSLNVGVFKDAKSVQIDIEKYTDDEKSLYIAGLFEICLALNYTGENIEDKLLAYLFKKRPVRRIELSLKLSLNILLNDNV